MFKDLVIQEKQRARELHGSFSSLHEIYGVLAEEIQEFFDEVRTKPDERDADNLLSELVQIAATAEMAAEDLQIVDVMNENEVSSKYTDLKSAVIDLINSITSGNILTTKHKTGKVYILDENLLDRVKELVND